jgi:hypothetical protein
MVLNAGLTSLIVPLTDDLSASPETHAEYRGKRNLSSWAI